MIEEMAQRYRQAPWEITGSRCAGAPAWMHRYTAWIHESAAGGGKGGVTDGE